MPPGHPQHKTNPREGAAIPSDGLMVTPSLPLPAALYNEQSGGQ